MPGPLLLAIAFAIIAAAVYAVARGVDVRLALLAAAFALAGLSGDVAPIVVKFIATFSDEQYVVPICTAMGFAYVLKHTGCDQHLVRLLTRPLRSARLFLIPGVVLVGFLVNIPVISQTSTAVCIGAVIVPLMRAARISSVTIGASILLGASIGGELLNPGAPELNTVGKQLTISPTEVVPAVIPLIFPHLAIATAIFWLIRLRAERRGVVESPATDVAATDHRVNLVRAMVPLLPLVLLFLAGPPLSVLHVPERWVVPTRGPNKDPHFETRLIGLAMLIGVLAAAVSNPRVVRGVPKAFFEGAGYAFTEVVSLIVTASCFGKAVELVGIARLIGEGIEHVPGLLLPVAGFVPLAFAALSGSGMASTQSLYSFFVEPSRALGFEPKEIGAVVSIGAAAGRTMSPVAAVALMSAKLTGTNAFQLARQVALPLLISLAVVILLRMGSVI
jgi:C4-dicarboxylate transporter, DcuC family